MVTDIKAETEKLRHGLKHYVQKQKNAKQISQEIGISKNTLVSFIRDGKYLSSKALLKIEEYLNKEPK